MDINNFFVVMFIAGCCIGVLAVIYIIRKAFSRQPGEIGGWEFRGALRRIFAVARTTIAEGIRAKIASGFIAVILVAVPLFWFTATGDGTIKGRIQMFIAYSMGFTGFFLSILTILFSCRSLSNEISSRQIFGIVSKPIPRWQILAGKWFGIMSLNVAILAVVGGATVGGSRLIMRNFKNDLAHSFQTDGGLTPEQSAQAVAAMDRVEGVGKKGWESPILAAMAGAVGMTPIQFGEILLRTPEAVRVDLRRADEVRRQVLIARAWATPQLPDVSKEAHEYLKKAQEDGQIPSNMSDKEALQMIEQTLLGRYISAPPGASLEWELKGPPPMKNDDFIMSLRFKMQTSRSVDAFTYEGGVLEGDTMLCAWGVGDPQSANSYVLQGPQPVNTFQEVELPANCVKEDGSIPVGFVNLDPREFEIFFDLPEGLQILYRVGSFELNIVQACLALLIPIACLASFGVCASTFLSFPVGVLIVFVLYIISSSTNFIADSLAVTDEYQPDVASFSYNMRKATVKLMGDALSIGDVDPVNKAIEGRSVGWPDVWEQKFVFLKIVVVMLIGVWVFKRRELAAIIV